MIDFIDKTSESSGTPLNRKNMMSIQGFGYNEITFNEDGSISEINSDGQEKTTVFNADGSITETFNGEKVIVKDTTFNSNGSILEVVR